MRSSILFAFLSFLAASVSFAQVKHVSLKRDQLLTVKTALGIATIIQTPDAIQSAIIGDQSGFKVEYLDNAVTVKPLRYQAKTNLYLVTGKQRFNIRLQTSAQEQADYIVYIVDREASLSLNWKALNRSITDDGITMTISRVGRTTDGLLLIEGTVSAQRDFSIKPEFFWLLQERESKLINSLFITALNGKKSTPLKFGISVSLRDLESKKALAIELRTKPKPLNLKLSEAEWTK